MSYTSLVLSFFYFPESTVVEKKSHCCGLSHDGPLSCYTSNGPCLFTLMDIYV